MRPARAATLVADKLPAVPNSAEFVPADLATFIGAAGTSTRSCAALVRTSLSLVAAFIVMLPSTAAGATSSPSSDFAAFATGPGCGAITISGNSYVDSFDSSKGSYSRTKQKSGAVIGTNGNVNLSGQAVVYGSLAALNTAVGICQSGTPGISLSGGAIVTDGYIRLSAPLSFSNPGPVVPGTKDYILSADASLPPGSYRNISMSGGHTLTLAPGTYNINSIVLSGQSRLTISPMGQVIINFAGTNISQPIQLSGGSIYNPSGIPLNFQLVYGGSLPTTLSGGSMSYAFLYAPNSAVTLSGGGDWFGALVVNTLNDSGGSPLHFDRHLAIPPTITAALSPLPNAVGWNNANVTVSFACSDSIIGIASCTSPITVTAEGKNQSVTGTAVNKAGINAIISVSVNLDKTPPTIAASQFPGPSANGWNNGNVTVSFACGDSLSGVANCPAPVILSTDGANQVVKGTVTDVAGNIATASITVNLDKTPPTIRATQSPPANANDWNNSNIVVTFTCSDATSGIVNCPPPQTVTTEGAKQIISGTAADNAGNTAGTSVTLNISKTPPKIVATASPGPNSSGWNNSNVTVSFTCTQTVAPIVTCPQPQTITTEGAGQIISGTATDVAGNSASGSVTVNLEKTAPTIASTVSPAPNAAGWNKSNVTVSFQCGASLSGGVQCPAAQTVSTEGAGQSVAGTVSDNAGNQASTSVTINLDKTPPTLSITAPANGSAANLPSVTVTGTASDSLSGPSSVTCAGVPATVSGSSFTCLAPIVQGPNSLSVQATDVAGNTAQTTVSVQGGIPALVSVSPNAGHQGQQSLSVTITGQFTQFAQGATTANFGAGVTVASLTVTGLNNATAVLNIDPAAATGPRAVSLTTGAEIDSLSYGFTVLGGQLSLSVQPPVSPTFDSSQQIAGSFANESGQTTVTISGGASGASQNLLTGQTNFGLPVALRPNAENLLTVTATDSSGQTATASNLRIVQLTLSNLVKAEVTAQRLSTSQVQALVANGTINLTNPSNFNVSMFSLSLTIGGSKAQQTTLSVPVAGPVGQFFSIGPPITMQCSQSPNADIEQNGNTLTVPCSSGSGGLWNAGPPQIELLPFEVDDTSGTGASVPGVLIIEGKIKTLKEFFNVDLLLMNLSNQFTLSDITAQINVPDNGLSPVAPSSGAIAMSDLAPATQGTGQFVIRGDVIGTHTVTVNFGALIGGPLLSNPVPISGSASTTLQVEGPPPLNVTVEQPATVTAGTPYTLKVNIQNTSSDLDALYASLELNLAGATLIDPTTGMPSVGPSVLSLGNILAGQSVSESYAVVPQNTGPITSCVGGASQNITLSVVFTNSSQGCAVGTIPSQVVSPSGQPTVTVLPSPNTTNVPVNAPIDLLFSDAIQTPTVTAGVSGATFTLFDPNGNAVPGQLGFSALPNGSTAAIFQPNAPLASKSVYQVVVSPSIFDTNGMQLASGMTSTFTTAPPPPVDTTPPLVSIQILPPANPSAVPQGQLLQVLVNSSDNSGVVARVDLVLDGQLVDSQVPQSSVTFLLDTSSLSSGSSHVLMAVATDPSGNTNSAAINIAISSDTIPPTVALSAAATVLQGQTLPVSIQAADNVRVARVDLFLDAGAVPVYTGFVAPYQASLGTTQLSNGVHQLVAIATDGAGNVAQATQAFLVRSIASIVLSPGMITLNGTGSTQSLTVTATLTDATTTPVHSGVAFSSSNTNVAVVDSSGIVTSVTPGTATITATFGSLPPAQATVTDIASVPATLALASGNNQTGFVGQQLAAPIVVKATDANNRPVPNVAVTFSVLAGGGTVAQSTVVTDTQGLGSTTLTLGQTPGANSATATGGTLAGSPVTFVATGILPTPGLSPTATSELFNLNNLNWSPLGAMSIPRGGTTLTVLGDATVLVIGGVNTAANMFSSVVSGELFTPATGSWTPTTSLIAPRAFHTTTLLPNGDVLITGGLDASGNPVATTEVYRGPPIQKTTPVITWATPAAITHATPLGSAQLNANANVPGTFVYGPPAGTILGVGSQKLTVTFTPSDTIHYTTATATVTLTVTP